MEKSRDSSVWRDLAVAFGDGLAFGVGMKLTQNVAGKPGRPVAPDLPVRLAQIEQRVERLEQAPAAASLDQEVLEALVATLETRLQENTAQLGRRFAALDEKFATELKTLRQQDQALASGTETHVEEIHQEFHEQVVALRQKVSEDRNALQSQVIALHREFASAVADIVEDQVASQVEQRVADEVNARLAPLEQRLREEIQQASASGRREIADLRQRIAESGHNVLNALVTIGELFRQAAGRFAAPNGLAATSVSPAAEEGAGIRPAATPEADEQEAAVLPINEPARIPPKAAKAAEAASSYSDCDLPEFAQSRKAAPVWNIPLVSSFVITAGCLAALQYL